MYQGNKKVRQLKYVPNYYENNRETQILHAKRPRWRILVVKLYIKTLI